MPESLWTRVFRGRNVQSLALSGDRVAFTYVNDQGQFGTPGPLMLRCLDYEGHELWRLADHGLACGIGDGRFIVLDATKRPRICELEGRTSGGLRYRHVSVTCDPVRSVVRRERSIIFETERELVVTDLALDVLERHPYPPGANPRCPTLVDGGLVWLDGDAMVWSDATGGVRARLRIPLEMVEAELTRFEEETGQPALGGLFTLNVDDLSKLADAIKANAGTPYRMGQRFKGYEWHLLADEELLFLSNGMPPHVILCMDHAGTPRWCRYINFACCGGTPKPLPNGLYVTSSSCGGILSWLDADGNLLFQTDPPTVGGLAGAYGDDLVALTDSRSIVSGGPGLVAHGVRGEKLWTWRTSVMRYAVDEPRDRIFTAGWGPRDGEESRVSLECGTGLSS